MNGTLSFYECRLSSGTLRGGGDTQIVPAVIKLIELLAIGGIC